MCAEAWDKGDLLFIRLLRGCLRDVRLLFGASYTIADAMRSLVPRGRALVDVGRSREAICLVAGPCVARLHTTTYLINSGSATPGEAPVPEHR